MKVDIVLPWVDGSDYEWQKEKSIYEGNTIGDMRINRYRDWNNLQYLFRGIEKFLPWIDTIHFITYGHLPPWLNINHKKLHIVNHKDFIPEKYLPTFSANPIEMNMHRIAGLSDFFIYVNDDMFFLKEMKPTDFFINNLPVDSLTENVHFFKKDGIDCIIANDLEIINSHFLKRNLIRKHFTKLLNIHYGKSLLKNIYLLPFKLFVGFDNPHLPQPFLKSSFEKIWKYEAEILDNTCRNKFRSKDDVNQWLVRYWQLAEGMFVPNKPYQGKFFSIGKDKSLIEEAITQQKYKMICLSDDSVLVNYECEKQFLNRCFDRILSQKSSYEL